MLMFRRYWLDNVIYRMTAVVSYVDVYTPAVVTVATFVLQVVTQMKNDGDWRKKKELYKSLFKMCDKKVSEISGGFKHLFSETLTSYMRIVVYLNSDSSDESDEMCDESDEMCERNDGYEIVFW